jgi:AcrR family transcriptional regulator
MLNERDIPQQQRTKDRVQATLDAAKNVLAAKGYGSMTLNAVCKEAGVKPTSIYRYWPNQVALMASLIEVFEKELSDGITAISKKTASMPWRDAQRDMLVLVVAYCQSNQWIYAGRAALAADQFLTQRHAETIEVLSSHVVSFYKFNGMPGTRATLERAANMYILMIDSCIGALGRAEASRQSVDSIITDFYEAISAVLAPYYEGTIT